MLPQKHRCFVGCDDDSAAVEAKKPSVLSTYATRLLNDGSDIAASDEVLSAATIYR